VRPSGTLKTEMSKRDDIDRLHDEIRELVDDLWQVPRFVVARRGIRPNVDCIRSEDPPELHVVVELPGVDPTQIKVVAADRVLVVAGERCRPRVAGRYQQMELEYGPFQRRIPIDEPVDTAAATARYEQGLLTVVLPIAAKPPKRERVSIAIGTME
jgi:HSP20 family protein